MSIYESQIIFACNVGKLINEIYKRGYTCTLGEAWRSAEQAELYAKEGKGIVNSLHCERLAIDINLFKNDIFLVHVSEYEPIGNFWTGLHKNNVWGGCWSHLRDANHFQMSEIK